MLKINKAQMEQIMALYRSTAPKPAAKKEKRKDEISVSFEARLMQEVKDTLKDTPDVRQEKVQELKETIARGEYSVSSQDVAERMLQNIALDRLLGPEK